MSENTNQAQAMELQGMLHDGQGTSDILSVPVSSSQQASESTIVPIEQAVEDDACCLRYFETQWFASKTFSGILFLLQDF